MELKGIGWNGTDWVDLTQDSDNLRTLMNTVMNLPFS